MIRKYLYTAFVFLLFGTIVIISSCKKDVEINPFDDEALQPPVSNSNIDNIPHDNFAYLHAKVFKPTCANVSCHDGTFEPDFRNISSAYYTLVYQPINMTFPGYDYRVLPGNANQSFVIKRLTQFPFGEIGQGRMPFIDSLWSSKNQNQQYIQDIKNWINAGAKDMFGNAPATGNQQPQIVGLKAALAGSMSFFSVSAPDPIAISAGNDSIDVWVAFADDSTLSANIICDSVKISTSLYDFSNAIITTNIYTDATGFTNSDFTGTSTVSFHHRVRIFSNYPSNTVFYLRFYLRDAVQSATTEIPNTGTGTWNASFKYSYFYFKII